MIQILLSLFSRQGLWPNQPMISRAHLYFCLAALPGVTSTVGATEELPAQVRSFGPVTTSTVKGSPEPPLPFKAERIHPEFNVKGLITAKWEPGTGQLIYTHRTKGNVTRVRRAAPDWRSTNSVTLLETNQVTYSIAFHPGYLTNGFLFTGSKTHWQERPNQKVQIVRHTVSRNKAHLFDAGSATVILEWPSNGHDGAAMAFSPDGLMFVTTGDGTSDSDDNNRGQGLDHLLAKVLRINVDVSTQERRYGIPPDNPFVNHPGARAETWAYGFRNPWRAAIDPTTGHLWVTQNGQDVTEQVYLVRRGANYGWSVMEGSRPFRAERKRGPTPISPPTAEHAHHEARSLTGGIVYGSDKLPLLKGAYIYGDYSTGKIWAIRHDGKNVLWHQEIADTPLAITGFLESPDGELLILDYQTGGNTGLYRLVRNDAPDRSAAFPLRLSASGLFTSVEDHQLRPEVVPYSVNAELWSDGAIKERYLALPGGTDQRAGFAARRGWEFPNGTVAIKSFALELREGDASSKRWIETRFLTRQNDEWTGYSYAWNAAQTDAFLVDTGGSDLVFDIRATNGLISSRKWRIPGRAECMVCHTRASKYVLGLSTLQLNRDHDYGRGFTTNQLALWQQLDLLKPLRKGIDLATQSRLGNPLDASQDLDLRARSYLQANCAICHVDAGGGDSRFNVEFHLKLDQTQLLDQPPVHGDLGLPRANLIVAGDPIQSLLWQRMARRGAGQMPPIATHLADPAGSDLIAEWIRQLK
jgi:uncharacterized repeat protein (TIGR03806 family)